ncbi:MAG: single-stranded-DNA-specific exonuclease RecJ [Anaerolineae bacterium]|nr:single-stranded-DNA-specific exonuclease RecJ [Anaerolineae bacterium]
MLNWHITAKPNIAPDLLEFAGAPLLAQLLVQRGITTVEQARAFLDPEAYEPASPKVLPDLEQAVTRLNQAIKRQELICVWGDFDVDGQTATALLISTLQDLGARVTFYIPNRLTESHGIKIPTLEQILAQGVNLLLTCDTGITEHEAVQAAQVTGTDVIITDHHDLADTLPLAQAVINPKRLPAGHLLRELPGVGVAYKLAEALYKSHRRADESEALLDLVALGIVADVAQQTGDTRYLLQKGLATLQDTSRPGLQALLENANLKTNRLTEDHIGFWLAPRLNALGRLGDANLAVELLTTDNRARARIIALQLEALNDRRKMLVDRVVMQALSQLEDTPSLTEYNAIVLASTDWHPGVIGIAANRLMDQYGKPAILIALRPDGLGRGSARSIPGCDIHRALKTQAPLLAGFGGHPLAAGLAIRPDNIPDFRRGLSAALADCHIAAEKTLTIDAMVELPQISADLLATIQQLGPFGAGNPPVQLGCRGLRVIEEAIFGKTGTHRRLIVQDEAGRQQEVVWWGGATERIPGGRFDLAFSLSPDDYQGGDAVQVEWRDAHEWEPAPVIRPPEFIDWRQTSEVQTNVAELANPLIWAEGVKLSGLSALPRHQLYPADTLVIWTAPPGQDILQQVLAIVRPRHIFLVGQPSSLDSLPTFAKQLMGLIKYTLSHKQNEVYLPELAAALGHRVTTARLGINWLVGQGKLTIMQEEEERLILQPAQNTPIATVAVIEDMLQAMLAETMAYRHFFKKASLTALEIGSAFSKEPAEPG